VNETLFPGSDEHFTRAREMNKTLVRINGIDFPQSEFAFYMNRYGFSAKTYAGDFMQEVFDLFVRDIVTTLEKENMEVKHPEISYLVQEYRDGMLLFEISSDKIWNKPAGEQDALEKQWIEELNGKYPVSVHWEVLKKIKNKR
jgi:peptidyl-prolyl cis-trans isomerase SurA